jgi:hypothetical protein
MSKCLLRFMIVIITILTAGCAKSTPTQGVETSLPQLVPSQSAYPYPIGQPANPAVESAYPAPISGNNASGNSSSQSNTVTQLFIPTPSSGKAVITGQLLIGGKNDHPLITTLYLVSAAPASTPAAQQKYKPSEQTDPVAVQEMGTGKFLYDDVNPGKYVLVIWNPIGSFPLKDINGEIIQVDAKPNQTVDLGVIAVK